MGMGGTSQLALHLLHRQEGIERRRSRQHCCPMGSGVAEKQTDSLQAEESMSL